MELKSNWDKYFYNVCCTIASHSKCYSRKIGSIIVKNKSIISTGYNGPPAGVPPCSYRYDNDPVLKNALYNKKINMVDKSIYTCPRRILGYKSGDGIEYCVAAHAERNAISFAAKNGISVEGSTLYLNWIIPCKECILSIINAGISEIVCTDIKYYDIMSSYLIFNGLIKVRVYDFNNEIVEGRD